MREIQFRSSFITRNSLLLAYILKIAQILSGDFVYCNSCKKLIKISKKNEPRPDRSCHGTLNLIFMPYLYFILGLISFERNAL